MGRKPRNKGGRPTDAIAPEVAARIGSIGEKFDEVRAYVNRVQTEVLARTIGTEVAKVLLSAATKTAATIERHLKQTEESRLRQMLAEAKEFAAERRRSVGDESRRASLSVGKLEAPGQEKPKH